MYYKMRNLDARVIKYFFANIPPLKTVDEICVICKPLGHDFSEYTIFGADNYNYISITFRGGPLLVGPNLEELSSLRDPIKFYSNVKNVARLIKSSEEKAYTHDYIDVMKLEEKRYPLTDIRKLYKEVSQENVVRSLVFPQIFSLYAHHGVTLAKMLGRHPHNYPVFYNSTQERVSLDIAYGRKKTEDYFTFSYHSDYKLPESFTEVFDLRSLVYATMRRNNKDGYITFHRMEKHDIFIQSPKICYFYTEKMFPIPVKVEQMLVPFCFKEKEKLLQNLVKRPKINLHRDFKRKYE